MKRRRIVLATAGDRGGAQAGLGILLERPAATYSQTPWSRSWTLPHNPETRMSMPDALALSIRPVRRASRPGSVLRLSSDDRIQLTDKEDLELKAFGACALDVCDDVQ
jgi:hypothetical protein